MTLKGTIIEESLAHKEILKELIILKTRVEPVTEKHHTPWLKQWTLLTVEIQENEARKVAKKLMGAFEKDHPWYIDFKNDKIHFIIFPNMVFEINPSSKEQYNRAKKYGLSLGIPEHQVDFHPAVKEWKR